MENIRVGIVGVGNIGSAHLAVIAGGEIEGFTLGALCDISEEKREELAKKHPDIPVFSDYREMIGSGTVDAVIVSVPHILHAEIAGYALANGMHTLVEKPVDISVSRARALNAIAEKSDKVFCIMFNQRNNPLFQKAREIVKSGALGELKRSVWIVTNWYRTQAYYDSGDWRATWAGEGGGVLLNQAPHNLDIWQWICGMPRSVTAFCTEAKYHRIEVEDDVTIYAEYENGATGCFITTTGEYPGTNRLEISGDRGKLVLEGGMLKWWRLAEPEREVCFRTEDLWAKIDSEYTEIKDEDGTNGHVLNLQNFANAILKGTPLLAPGIEGINELTLSNAAYLSAWTGETVTFPMDDGRFLQELRRRQAQSAVTEEQREADIGNYKSRWNTNW